MRTNIETNFETSIERLEDIEGCIPTSDIYSVSAAATSYVNGYEYDYTFLFDNPTGQHITIASEKVSDFMQKGKYIESIGDLARVGQHTRRFSGGQFDINPTFGAILGLQVDTAGPGIARSLVDSNVQLSMAIDLEDTSETEPTKIANRLSGITRLNQINRDSIEDINRLGWWDREFNTYNSNKIFGCHSAPEAMQLTGKSVAQLLMNLQEEDIIDEVRSTVVRLKSDLRV